jgi:hypothetical protein
MVLLSNRLNQFLSSFEQNIGLDDDGSSPSIGKDLGYNAELLDLELELASDREVIREYMILASSEFIEG